MDQHNKAVETARQTLLQLSKSRIAPTPDNYRKIYNSITGQTAADNSLALGQLLNKLL